MSCCGRACLFETTYRVLSGVDGPTKWTSHDMPLFGQALQREKALVDLSS